MLKRLKNVLRNWNLPEEQIALIQNEIDEYNYNRLFFVVCAFACISLISLGFTLYQFLYEEAVAINAISFLLSGVFIFCLYKYADSSRKYAKVLAYLQMTIAMGFTVYIDALGPTDLAVLYAPIVLLFMCIYIERPYRMYSYFIAWEIIFVFCASHYKQDYEFYTDVLDTVVFTIFAMLMSYHVNKIKVRNFYNIYELSEVKLKEAKLRLKDAELDLLQRQIRPHFIYNTMNAMSGLCKQDPAKADELINLFAKYLRSNIDTMGNKKLVTFREELDNVSCFVNIISIRYQEEYDIIYNLQVTDFEIPIFSLEPIVENAIVHGLRNTSKDKYIFITTKREENKIHIVIKDNGRGFEPSKEHEHLSTGLKNVAYRLENLLQARLEINSQVGIGTSVDIWIPVKDNGNEYYLC